MTSVVRIANASGFYGDRLSAMREQLTGGPLDYVTGDYLAELTMLILGRDRMKDPELGYAKTFLRQLTDCLGLAVERGVKVVSNAGGLNPAGLAAKLRALADEQGLDVSIAYVEGDDLRDRADELGFPGALTANAYLGAFGIAEALGRGADVVVTGRVTDASVVMGPAIAHHGWTRDDLDQVAGALVAGHVVECGAQATGGNFAGFADGSLTLPGDLLHPGFPIAEIASDGSAVITKHPDTGGRVSVDTVTAQLVYEVGTPDYLNPDVVAALDTVELTASGDDRVLMSGVRGSPPPPSTKVCLNRLGGFRNSVEFLLTGLDVDAKAELVRAQLDDALATAPGGPPDEVEWQLARTTVADPDTQEAATSVLRCHVTASDPDRVGRAFSSAAVELALASYPGFTVTRPPAAGSPFGVYEAAYLPQVDVPHEVVLDTGERLSIAPPKVTATPRPRAEPRRPEAARGDAVQRPLGTVAYARSGDKGGDANVGVWIRSDHSRRDAAYAWLVGALDEATVRRLLPETAGLPVHVHPLPNLCAVNIVVEGLLGAGVAASTRIDPQAKALGEWLRARYLPIPVELVT